MFRHYGRGEAAWPAAVQRARAFIAGPLHRHVTGWPRHGRLGVPAGLDPAPVCAELHRLIEDHGEFGLLCSLGADRLLVLPVHEPHETTLLCYGPWPGIETWEVLVEPQLPRGVSLLHTRWNAVPRRLGTRLTAPRPR